jgi:hypothetical protein
LDRRVRRRPLQGFRSSSRLFRSHVAVLRTALAGLTRLSKRSARRSGVMGCRSLLAVSTAARCSVDRSVARPEGRTTASTGFAALSGFGSRRPHRSCTDRVAPPGVSRPSSDIDRGDPYDAGLPLPPQFRPRGFSPPRRVALPSVLRARWARCRSWGFDSKASFEREGRDASPRPLRPLDSGACPRTLTSTRSHTPDSSRRLSLHALVPWPWSQRLSSPSSKPIIPKPWSRLSPAPSPRALLPETSGRTMTHRAGAPGSFTDSGTSGSARDPQLP